MHLLDVSVVYVSVLQDAPVLILHGKRVQRSHERVGWGCRNGPTTTLLSREYGFTSDKIASMRNRHTHIKLYSLFVCLTWRGYKREMLCMLVECAKCLSCV